MRRYFVAFSGYPVPRMTKLFDLSGKAALITSGSKGLGKCMARAFAQAGADVFICSRSSDELKAAAAGIAEGLAPRVEYMTADLASPRSEEHTSELQSPV